MRRGAWLNPGISPDPKADLDGVLATYKERGIIIDGVKTDLIHGIDFDTRKRPVAVISTGRALDMEAELLAVAGRLATDKTGALTQQQVDAGAERLLARSPHVDPAGKQWGEQKAVMALGGQPLLGSLSADRARAGRRR